MKFGCRTDRILHTVNGEFIENLFKVNFFHLGIEIDKFRLG